ncbi:ester cyclase [Undibacterium pigrum]|uniref:SnoaL-like polyketide cyclase n=1 Tax=Undibacterium pigrum TaxID=401470 RepID=A0A318J4J8_9BURK|nr:ester cyclase [Undibacterium pigrum]PXX41560.1 SnoaL-like polyketide cyclase [Undibacterium pigrum]
MNSIRKYTRKAIQVVAAIALAGSSLTTAYAATVGATASAPPAITPAHQGRVLKSHQLLIKQWISLWNGDLELAKSIIAPDFALHATLLDGRSDTVISGPAGLAAWVAQSHGLFKNLQFSIQVGPIVDANFVVLRWEARGNYGGGMPGANAPVGTPVKFTGTDILRIEGGKVKDYWLNADTANLLMQLKFGQGPTATAN